MSGTFVGILFADYVVLVCGAEFVEAWQLESDMCVW